MAVKPLRDMFRFSGRSTRTEVGAFYLLGMIANLFVSRPGVASPGPVLTAAATAWALLWIFPWIALTVRRFHDQGRSWRFVAPLLAIEGFLLASSFLLPGTPGSGMSVSFGPWVHHPPVTAVSIMLFLTAGAGALAYIVLMLTPRTDGPNRFGPDPRLADSPTPYNA